MGVDVGGLLALRMDLNSGCRAKALVRSVERKRPKGRARVQSQRLERLERLGRAWKQNSEAKKSFEGSGPQFLPLIDKRNSYCAGNCPSAATWYQWWQ